jgi:hypothetical protein
MEIKPNDYFHFRYHPLDGYGWDSRTHCFEGLLLACLTDSGGILLRDTYWNRSGRDGRYLTPAEAEAEGTLTFYCNLDDIEKIDSYRKDYYAETDLFCLTTQHACSHHCVEYFKRKGASFNVDKMLSVVDAKIQDARRQLNSTVRDLELLSVTKSKIEGGDTTVYI